VLIPSCFKYCPFFLQLPGFPVFGTGQTTLEGFEKCLEPVLKKYGDEKHVFWVNLRSVQLHNCPFYIISIVSPCIPPLHNSILLTSIEMFKK
jgi:hypothetical protein